MLWNLFAAALLVYVVERRFHPRPPGLFALYIALYSFGRFWIELVRVDPANHVLGLRVNTWVSGLVCIAGLVWFWHSQRRHRPRGAAAPPAGPKMAVPKSRVRRGG
jgi:prolipoprotein diacylglyceryltransferase